MIYKIHTKIILACNMLEYAPLFQEIADAYFENELYNLALPLYEDLASEEQVSRADQLHQAAQSHPARLATSMSSSRRPSVVVILTISRVRQKYMSTVSATPRG